MVGLLDAGGTAAESAATALGFLSTKNAAMDDFVREAGGIPPLVALLGAGADSKAAANAAGALSNLSLNDANGTARRCVGWRL